MNQDKNKWLTISVCNLAVLAFLGVLLRSKIMFSIPWIDFKNLLQAHSHFAFGGWITLCLMTLMTYEILPGHLSGKKIYKWLLSGILFCSVGMVLSFPFEGYAFVSILFSTLFIFVSYGFAWVFIRDLVKSGQRKAVKILSICALLSLTLSSAGPFTLAYILASHSVNTMLYRDSIYTYLHLQYNGFFTLAVFALFLNLIGGNFNEAARKNANRFAVVLCVSVLPTLVLSYLWHFENATLRSIGIVGCVCLIATLALFLAMMRSSWSFLKTLHPLAKAVGLLSMIAFALKTIIQIGIIFPAVGKAVFGDRPIIIAYLHLVMLGFLSLYLLAHLIQVNFFQGNYKLSKRGIIVFSSGVIVNEAILATQGLTAFLMLSSTLYPCLLLIAAIWLFSGAALIAASVINNRRAQLQE
jgi:hypothetical protein